MHKVCQKRSFLGPPNQTISLVTFILTNIVGSSTHNLLEKKFGFTDSDLPEKFDFEGCLFNYIFAAYIRSYLLSFTNKIKNGKTKRREN